MELAVTGNSRKTKRTSKCPRIARPPSPSSSPSSSASTWGLSGHVGIQVLTHRDLITCRFFRSLPRSWLKKYWGQLGEKSNKHLFSFLSSSARHRSSSPFSLSSYCFPSCPPSVPARSLCSPISRLSSPALKDRDRERDQAGSASSQSLDGHPCPLCAPGMTIGQWGPNAQLTATHTSCSTASTTSSLGHSLHHHSGSG